MKEGTPATGPDGLDEATEPRSPPGQGANGSVLLTVDTERFARQVFVFWLVLELVLVLLDGVFNCAELAPTRSLRRLMNMAREDGVGTWFAATQALLVAAAIWLVRARLKASGGAPSRVRGWTILAACFAYLATDDAARIHERIGTSLGDLVESGHGEEAAGVLGRLLDAFPTYTWHLVFGPVFGAMAIYMVVFSWKELRPFTVGAGRRVAVTLACALACYVVAVGLDFFEGLEGGHEALANVLGLDAYDVSHWQKVTEEFLEMLGTTFFLVGFLRQSARLPGPFDVRLT